MKTTQILEILKVVAWILFVGLCVETAALIVSFLVTMFGNHDGAKSMYLGMDLSHVYTFDPWHFVGMASLVIYLSGLKAYLFLQVVRIVTQLNVVRPFTEDVAKYISRMSGIALQIGITAIVANGYANWLMHRQVVFDYEGGETEYLFLAGILFVIVQIFKRGLELQKESELTI